MLGRSRPAIRRACRAFSMSVRNDADMKRPNGGVAAATCERPSSLQDQAYVLLKRMLKDGRLQPGERLLEAEVVRAFGISRSPARGALRALHKDRLLLEDGKRGYCVVGKDGKTAAGDRLAVLDAVKITQPRQWERIYHQVEQELLAGMLFSAVRINDLRLAEYYEVSRTVTRDLLARMHGVGLIFKDDAGRFVAPRITPERIRHLFELRVILEPQALLQAAPVVPQRLLEQARDNITLALADHPIDSAKFDRAEIDLHSDILSFSPNKEIVHALERTALLFAPTRHLLDPLLGIPMEMIEAALREHMEIIDFLHARKPDRAARALRAHIESAIGRWLPRFEAAAIVKRQTLPCYLVAVDRSS
jgi:DNA-binding GntR family transcriptional regulator